MDLKITLLAADVNCTFVADENGTLGAPLNRAVPEKA